MRTLGGAIADELGAELSAVGAVQAGGFLNSGVLLMDPSLDPVPALQPLRDLVARSPGRPHRADASSAPASTLADAYPADVVARLAEVKRRVDPDGIIRSNRPLGRE